MNKNIVDIETQENLFGSSNSINILKPYIKDFVVSYGKHPYFNKNFEFIYDLNSYNINSELFELIKNPLDDIEKINERSDLIGRIVNYPKIIDFIYDLNEVLEYYELFFNSFELHKKERHKLESGKLGRYHDFYRIEIIDRNKLKNKLNDFSKETLITQGEKISYDGYDMFIESDFIKNIGTLYKCFDKLDNKMSEINVLRDEINNLTDKELSKDRYKNLNEEDAKKNGEKIRNEFFEIKESEMAKIYLGILNDEVGDNISYFSNEYKKIKTYIKTIYQLAKFSEIIIKHNYSKATILPKEYNKLVIKKGIYDIGRLRSEFGDNSYVLMDVVPNDTSLENGINVEVVQGDNNGGKTFYMKNVFYTTIMALSMGWVPAEHAEISIRDKIIFRAKGTGDNLSALQQDIQNINHLTTLGTSSRETDFGLLGLDEVFMSTNEDSANALFYGLAEYISETNNVLILPTHILDVNQLEKNPSIKVSNMESNHIKKDGPSKGGYATKFVEKHAPEIFT